MALNPADIATVSRLLDEALALEPVEREAWLAALPPEQQRHAEALRGMLAQEAELDNDPRLVSLPKLASDEAVAHVDDRVGPYRLLREIGRGGMGSVWLAERADGAYKREVALKLPRLAWGAGLAERMAREREIGMLLEHPNIARLYDAGVDERGRPFLALEYVDGQPIDAWCEAQGLSVRDRLRLFVQVAKAVAYAHGRLVVHRDLKPSNVLVTQDGQAHLLDFGIAKLLREAAPGEAGLTQQQGRVMTPYYASPEQVAGDAITVQSDVYSLGVLLYELLTGTLPIAPKRGTLGAVEDAILGGNAPLASSRVKNRATARALRTEVDAILAKAMQREPGRRYATADALALDIERHLKGETVAARPDSMVYRLSKTARRHWVGVSAAAAVLIAVLTGSGVAVVQAQRAVRSAERERVVKQFVADVFRANARVDRDNAAMRPKTAQALIEDGARLIEQRFSGQPEIQAELYGVVGGVFADMGAYQLAVDYGGRQFVALAAAGAGPAEQAVILLRLAQAHFDDENFKDADVRVRKALDLGPHDQHFQLDCLVLLARTQLGQAQRNQAIASLAEIKRRIGSMGAAAPLVTQSWAHALEATFALGDDLLPDRGLLLLDKAIQLAVLAEGPLSGAAITMRLAAALQLVRTANPDRSVPYFEAAIDALRRLGGAHAVRAALASATYTFTRSSGGGHGSFSRAITELERSLDEMASSTVPVPEGFTAQVKVWIGDLTVDAGNVEAGLKLLETYGPVLKRFRDNPRNRQLLGEEMGGAFKFAGQHEAAQRWYMEKLEAVQQMFPNKRWVIVSAYADLFINEVYWGRLDDAEIFLERASRLAAAPEQGAEATWEWQAVRAMRARLHLTRSEPIQALRLLYDNGPMTTPFVEGEALCAAGQPARGLILLQDALRRVGGSDEFQDSVYKRGTDEFPHAPWAARRRAIAGLCAVAMGDRSTALKFAAQARADFAVQPNVSPYFKAPLLKLERALGLKLPPV